MEFNMFLFPKPNHNNENKKLFESNLFKIPKNIFVKKIKFSKKKFGIKEKDINSINSIETNIKKKEKKNKINKNMLSLNFDINLINRKEPETNLYSDIKNNCLSEFKNQKNYNLNFDDEENIAIQIPKTKNNIKMLSQKFISVKNNNIESVNSLKKNINDYNSIKNTKIKRFDFIDSNQEDFKFDKEKIRLNYEMKLIKFLKEKNKFNLNYRSNPNLSKYSNILKEKFNKHINEKEELFPIILFTTFEFGLGNSNDVGIFYHGNGEDMFGCIRLARKLCFTLKLNILIMEYPGYSIYEGSPNEKQILKNSIQIYDYLRSWNLNNIILIGRSIGTGPSSYWARYRNIHSLILISPFISIKDVIKNHVGKILSWVVKQRFNNLKRIIKIKCPILIIHGHKDTLIPIFHARTLKKEYEKSKFNNNIRKYIYLKEFKYMTHNISDTDSIIVHPIINFFNNLKNKKIY